MIVIIKKKEETAGQSFNVLRYISADLTQGIMNLGLFEFFDYIMNIVFIVRMEYTKGLEIMKKKNILKNKTSYTWPDTG